MFRAFATVFLKLFWDFSQKFTYTVQKSHIFKKLYHFQKAQILKTCLFLKKPIIKKLKFSKSSLFQKNNIFQKAQFFKKLKFSKAQSFKKLKFSKSSIFQKALCFKIQIPKNR